MKVQPFSCVEGHLPRFELCMPDEHFLLSWESISNIRASGDYLNLSFFSEIGHVQINSGESLQELFEALQMECVRIIDGRKLNCKIFQPEQAI